MKPGATVRVDYPGHALHRRLCTVVAAADTRDFGMLYVVREATEQSARRDVALPGKYLRPVMKRSAA